jgi:hypothetical protein
MREPSGVNAALLTPPWSPRKILHSRDCTTAALNATSASSAFGIGSFKVLGHAANANFMACVGFVLKTLFEIVPTTLVSQGCFLSVTCDICVVMRSA